MMFGRPSTARLSAADAFRLGHDSARLGLPFVGREIAGRLARTSSGALAAEAKRQVSTMAALAGEIVATVGEAEATLAKLGVKVTLRPTNLPEYRKWAAEVNGGAARRLAPSSLEGGALILGGTLGAFVTGVGLAVQALELLTVAPKDRQLLSELPRHSDSVGEQLGRLGSLLGHPALPPDSKRALQKVLDAASSAPRLDGKTALRDNLTLWSTLASSLPRLVDDVAAALSRPLLS